ncbi:rho GTPase-activating protein 7-like isoform X1 [Dromiciops gliroides]|uniref:rho GTPase-activating protein 7-like isoform X1 n=1 Tax=Dromiciops gliroides TaxID=33562 RepID=UPI001CC5CCFC|nr:rho GTPase-activating protein 7-like isoform X1 [Dromiciops gliroides]
MEFRWTRGTGVGVRGPSQLRRAFSEHIKDSTSRAWEVFWKRARERRLTEIEAKEACEWLRGTGFPQYAQLFDDMQFPIDIQTVQRDHEFLDQNAFESLYRRLNTLNKCAEMKVEFSCQRRRSDESEDDEPCAISSRWAYERCSRRWSRLDSLEVFPAGSGSSNSPVLERALRIQNRGTEESTSPEPEEKPDVSSMSSSSSGDSDAPFSRMLENTEDSHNSSHFLYTNKVSSPASSTSHSPCPIGTLNSTGENLPPVGKPLQPNRGKSFLRKMEKLRLRSPGSKRSGALRPRPPISGPVLLEGFDDDKLRSLNCVSIGREMGACPSSPPICGSSSGSQSETSSTVSTPSPVIRVRSHRQRSRDPSLSPTSPWGDVNEQNLQNQLFQVPIGHKPGTFPKDLTLNSPPTLDNPSVNWRTGSFHGCHRNRFGTSSPEMEPPYRLPGLPDNRLSVYDNVPVLVLGRTEGVGSLDNDVILDFDHLIEDMNELHRLESQWAKKDPYDGDFDFTSSPDLLASPAQILLEINEPSGETISGTRPGGGAEHHCKRGRPWDSPKSSCSSRPSKWNWSTEETADLTKPFLRVEEQSAIQLNYLKSVAMLNLSAIMEKNPLSSKQGWNWPVPKFIRKNKYPDFKGKNVFGVPLQLVVQRTGHPLPPGIFQAMEYLRAHFLDQVGLFRKSGVKSRIMSLREMNEAHPGHVDYEGHSAFDVADMVKQYFRDLPEPIFTSKICESILHIYQYLPKEEQFNAIQAAILLLPDENREALIILLFFLRDVVSFVEENQMTPTNIAVCLAPSLFHLTSVTSFRPDNPMSSRCSQKKHNMGKPDQRDLSENLAATQGLAHMIAECHQLFQLPTSYLESNRCQQPPVPEKSLVSHSLVLKSLEKSIQDLLRDSKDKFRTWASRFCLENVEVANKKVEENSHLLLWKACIDIHAAPQDIFQRVLRAQLSWDHTLQQAAVLEVLNEEADIYHYTVKSMTPLPAQDYVVLRTWKSYPQSNSYIIAATSVWCEVAELHGVLGEVMLCQYLIEMVAPEKSRVTHICRKDTRGRTSKWYRNVFGHMCAAELLRLKDSFPSSNLYVK